MGAVDLVIQVESPVGRRGLQRIGRAGHQVGERSRAARSSPSTAATCSSAPWSPSACATARSSRRATAQPARRARPADRRRWRAVDEWRGRRPRTRWSGARAPFAELSRRAARAACSTCSPAAIPSEEFAELRPRIVWDRVRGHGPRARAAPSALAVTNGGTIPDRGLFGVSLPDGTRGRRARRGDGLREPPRRDVPARRVDLAHRGHHPRPRDRHARAGRTRGRCRSGTATAPAARSSSAGRSARFVRELRPWRRERGRRALRDVRPRRRARPTNLLALPREQAEATRRRARRPHDRRRALPRRDRRLARLRPLAVRRPRPRAVGAWRSSARIARRVRPRVRGDLDATTASSSACPSADEPPGAESLLIDPDEIEELVVARAAEHGAVRARASARTPRRALLLPARRPGQRTPLWQQRRRPPTCSRSRRSYAHVPDPARDLPRVPARRLRRARRCGELLRRPAARASCARRASRRRRASPFASSLLFGYVATYMYEGDAPLRRAARRRAGARPRPAARAARARRSCASCSTPTRSREVEADLQRRSRAHAARATADELHDVLRRLGDLTPTRSQARGRRRAAPASAGSASWSPSGGRSALRIGGEERWIAAEDAGLLPRRARRRRRPAACPTAFLEPTSSDPLERARRAATPAPTARSPTAELARPLRPSTVERRCCASSSAPGDAGPRRVAARRQRARVVRPRGAAPAAPARRSPRCARRSSRPTSARSRASCPRWQGVDAAPPGGAGVDRLREVLVPLQGVRSPREVWERDVLPAPRAAPTRRRGSTSSARAASSSGSAPGARAQLRQGRALLPRGRALLGPPPVKGSSAPERRARTTRSASARRRRRASGPTCSPSSPTSSRRSSRRRSGTWPGRAR